MLFNASRMFNFGGLISGAYSRADGGNPSMLEDQPRDSALYITLAHGISWAMLCTWG